MVEAVVVIRRLWWVWLVVVAVVGAGTWLVVTRSAPSPGLPAPPSTTVRAIHHPDAGAARPASRCHGTNLRPSSDLQAALRSSPAGRTFCFAKGTYRLRRPLNPKDGQRLIAAPGALLNGAKVLSSWRQVDNRWVSDRVGLPGSPEPHGECATGNACQFSEDIFIDDRPLRRVMNRSELAPGRFWEDYPADQVWLADDPGSRRIEVALASAAVLGGSKNVQVDGFIVEKFANPAQSGAIEGRGTGWSIVANEVRLNHGTGLGAIGGRMIGNHTHHNGQMGMGGKGDKQVVADNEIDHNNTAGFDPQWEAGGGKWVETVGLTIKDNYVHDNVGVGLWTDINNVHTTYDGNIIRDNALHGIHHEISFDAVLTNNEIIGNGFMDPQAGWGGAGIRIAESPDVRVEGNRLIGNANGIMLVQQVRTDAPSPLGPHRLSNVQVVDNDVSMRHGATGIVEDVGDPSIYTRRNIVFRNNTYRLLNGQKPFAWKDGLTDMTTWVKRYGQDTQSTFLGGS